MAASSPSLTARQVTELKAERTSANNMGNVTILPAMSAMVALVCTSGNMGLKLGLSKSLAVGKP